jgi:predicted nucleic acid-binding protein
MNLLTDIPSGDLVGLDTAPFIYFVEAHPAYGPLVRPLFESRIEPGLNLATTSMVTWSEVLVKPLQAGRLDLVQQYRDLLIGNSNLESVELTAEIGERSAELRAKYGIRLMDALQIAACLKRGADCFLTNDGGLRKVTEIPILVLQDYLPPNP